MCFDWYTSPTAIGMHTKTGYFFSESRFGVHFTHDIPWHSPKFAKSWQIPLLHRSYFVSICNVQMKLCLLWSAFLVLLTVSTLLMPPIRHLYPCISSCGRGSHTQRGLSTHQARCSHYRHEQEALLQRLSREAQSVKDFTAHAPPVVNNHPHSEPVTLTVETHSHIVSFNSTVYILRGHANHETSNRIALYLFPPYRLTVIPTFSLLLTLHLLNQLDGVNTESVRRGKSLSSSHKCSSPPHLLLRLPLSIRLHLHPHFRLTAQHQTNSECILSMKHHFRLLLTPTTPHQHLCQPQSTLWSPPQVYLPS